ncbi:hypothetical protein [Klebsiella variicola]|uniref:hypothetical protein n=1 Tax=Klebsiella variicola TaxID=244366 RepID=UPI0021145770|nr:hypothetical protein [Klebsiella variicola]MEC6197718.1 hypothetical protein [Klebsiella variicola]
MNTLLFPLIRALRSHDWLRFLGLAYVLSSLGNGLTQVIVFLATFTLAGFSRDSYHSLYAVNASQFYREHLGRSSV